VVNKYWLRAIYVNQFIQVIDYFSDSLINKVLPAFNDLQEEANRVEQEAYNRLASSVDPEWFDPGDIWEPARDAGVDHYIMAEAMVQGITNMFTAGLYHLFEQQLLKFHRQQLLLPSEEDNPELLRFGEVQKRLEGDYKIDITRFPSFDKISELKLVANCVKHADGWSCEQLKKVRPDLFVKPSLKEEEKKWGILSTPRPVTQPLAGEDLYVVREEFTKYVEAVKGFWDELCKAFDLFEYKD